MVFDISGKTGGGFHRRFAQISADFLKKREDGKILDEEEKEPVRAFDHFALPACDFSFPLPRFLSQRGTYGDLPAPAARGGMASVPSDFRSEEISRR